MHLQSSADPVCLDTYWRSFRRQAYGPTSVISYRMYVTFAYNYHEQCTIRAEDILTPFSAECKITITVCTSGLSRPTASYVSSMGSSQHSPEDLVSTLLSVTESSIVPLTRSQVSSGSKLFGAAILKRSNLETLTIATNNERESPLLHGEINCIQTFFANKDPGRPQTKDCIFFATHEPCSLCLSGMTWSGFNEFYYLFTYEDSRDLFGIPYDIDILQSVYQVASPTDTPEMLASKPLYNRTNKFFKGRSVAELVDSIEDELAKEKWTAEIGRVKSLYNELSDTYQKGKSTGHETSSVFQ